MQNNNFSINLYVVKSKITRIKDYLKFPVIKVATPFNLKLTVGEGPVNFVTDKLKYTARRSKPSQLSEIKAELQNETVHFESIADLESPKRKRRRTTMNTRTRGGTKYPELDEVLMKWMDLQPISPDEEVVVKQAQSFAKEIGVNGFSGTSSWSKAFFLRYKAHKAEKLEVLSCSRNELFKYLLYKCSANCQSRHPRAFRSK